MPADDLAITPTDTKIDFGQKVSVKCAEADMITDSFVNLELVSEGHAFSEIYNPERWQPFYENALFKISWMSLKEMTEAKYISFYLIESISLKKNRK